MGTTYTINNQSDWETVASVSLHASDLVNLNTNITFTGIPSIINLNDATFNGQDNILTFHASMNRGLFKLSGGTIRNLNVDGNNCNLDVLEGALTAYQFDTLNYGTVTRCTSTNLNVFEFGGGLLGSFFGSPSDTSTVTACTSDATTNGSWTGGLLGAFCQNLTIDSCYFNGTSIDSIGGLVASVMGDEEINITRSYVNFTPGTGHTGGFIHSISDLPTVTIDQCFILNNLTSGRSGAFVYSAEEADNGSTTLNITNCYCVGDMGDNTGLIYYIPTSLVVNIANVYTAGSYDSSSSIIAHYVLTGEPNNVTDSVFNNPSGNLYKSSPTGVITSTNISTDIGDITNQLYTNWDTDIWDTTNSYPILKAFLPGYNQYWSGYITYDSVPVFRVSYVTYNDSTFNLGLNDTISPILEIGVTANQFSIIPALPTGLSIDNTTGIISGAPIIDLPLTQFTIIYYYNSRFYTTSCAITINASIIYDDTHYFSVNNSVPTIDRKSVV